MWKKNSNITWKQHFFALTLCYSWACHHPHQSRMSRLSRDRIMRATLEPFVPVLSRLHKRIVLLLRLSDCLTGYHPFPRIGSCLSLPCNFSVSSPPVVGWSHSLALSRALGGWVESRTLLASSRPLSLSALCEPLIHTLATRLQPILTDIGCLY